MSATCDIQFETNENNFFAGQMLRGTVKLTLVGMKSVRKAYVQIFDETYAIPSKKTLDEDTFIMEPGVYEYPFDFTLPCDLPTSFEDAWGYVRYNAHFVLKTPFVDANCVKPFKVIKPIDLNHVPKLREPLIVERNTTLLHRNPFRIWTCDSIKIVARTPIGGFTPGQTINLEIDVENKSDQSISKFSVHFIRQVLFPNSKDIAIHKQIALGCKANSNNTIHANIYIPSPTALNSSNSIQFRYLIRITGLVAFPHKNLVLELPITIGTYPVQFNTEPPNELCDIDPTTHENALRLNESNGCSI